MRRAPRRGGLLSGGNCVMDLCGRDVDGLNFRPQQGEKGGFAQRYGNKGKELERRGDSTGIET